MAAVLLAALSTRPDRPAQRSPAPDGSWTETTRGGLADRALRIAAGLRALGVGPGDRVGLVADCGPWWIAGDLGILASGGAGVPRGTETGSVELGGILSHSGARGCLTVGEEATRRALEAPGERGEGWFLARLDARRGEVPPGVIAGEDLLDRPPADPASLPARGPGDVAAILYTSGTTGRPKGVTLLHGNFLHQLRALPGPFDFREGDVFLVMLPPWHGFERIVEYVGLSVGGTLVYSHPRRLREHLPVVRPTWMASVPRIWELVLAQSGFERLSRTDPEAAARALRERLGGRLRSAVCGGGSVPDALDRSFNGAGIRFLVGYGLTETAPVLAVRLPGANRLGTVGRAVAETEIRIADRATGAPLGPGEEGAIRARGPQVMQGYWRDPGLTAGVLSPDGWLDTGDLGALTPEGDLLFLGRAKDTIALRGGEKVEPLPLEQRLMESPLIDQAVVGGSDRKVLAALIVPRRSALEAEVRKRAGSPPGSPVGEDEVLSLLKEECARLLSKEAGFKPYERIGKLALLEEPFTQENGLLTPTFKIRRAEVLAQYADLLSSLYGEGGPKDPG